MELPETLCATLTTLDLYGNKLINLSLSALAPLNLLERLDLADNIMDVSKVSKEMGKDYMAMQSELRYEWKGAKVEEWWIIPRLKGSTAVYLYLEQLSWCLLLALFRN